MNVYGRLQHEVGAVVDQPSVCAAGHAVIDFDDALSLGSRVGPNGPADMKDAAVVQTLPRSC